MKKILTSLYDGFIFIITLPFNLFKYANLAFYYVIKILLKESPEKEKIRREKEAQRQAEIDKEKKQAVEYLKNQNDELKFGT